MADSFGAVEFLYPVAYPCHFLARNFLRVFDKGKGRERGRRVSLENNNNMKLLTHNLLQSNVKGVQNGYPLKIQATTVNILDVPFNAAFVTNMLPRLEYAVLAAASAAVRHISLLKDLWFVGCCVVLDRGVRGWPDLWND